MSEPAGRLIITTPDGERVIALSAPSLTVGRNIDNAIVLGYAPVSGVHARIDITAAGPTITDLDSRNGTWIGETRLTANQAYRLTPDVQVRIFQCFIRFEPADAPPADEGPQPEETPVAPPPGTTTEVVSAEVSDAEAIVAVFRPPEQYRAPQDSTPSRYLRYLPSIFADGGFMGRYLRIFETIWEPLEWRESQINLYFDPRTCPPGMLPWLASWLDVALNNRWPEERSRALLANAAALYRARGTRDGLQRMIETVTGLQPVVRDDPARPFLFTVTLAIPAGSGVTRELVDELVRTHKPAHAGYILEITEA